MKPSSFLTATGSAALSVALVLACGGTADLGGTADGGAPVGNDGAPATMTEAGDGSVAQLDSSDGSEKAPFDPAQMARAAAFVGSCVPDNGTNRYLRAIYDDVSVDAFDLLLEQSGACFATKTNGCAAVTECLGVTASITGSCTSACDGQVRVTCDDALELRVDCAKTGETCSLVAGRPQCVTAGMQTCAYETFASSCTGGAPTYCGNGVQQKGPECAGLGLACVAKTGASPSATNLCAGTGAACASSSYGPASASYEGIRCDDPSTLRACVNTFEATRSCPGVGKGFTCQTSGTSSFCGLAAECIPGGAAKASCEGTSMVMCNAGKITKIDCTTLGFTGCTEKPGATGAVCTPSP